MNDENHLADQVTPNPAPAPSPVEGEQTDSGIKDAVSDNVNAVLQKEWQVHSLEDNEGSIEFGEGKWSDAIPFLTALDIGGRHNSSLRSLSAQLSEAQRKLSLSSCSKCGWTPEIFKI